MQHLIAFTLIIHVFSGISCFVSGLMAILSRKGSRLHKTVGKIYFIAMFLVLITAIAVSLYRNNTFLLYIAIFAAYLTYAGVRSIYNKKLHPNFLDWSFWIIAASTSIFMIASMNLILMVLGSLFAANLFQDGQLFYQVIKGKNVSAKRWLIRHIGMILGSYIATTTAFLVVNVQNFQPLWLPWLAPSIIGTPLIFVFIKKITANPVAK